ncbi:MAG: reverse transcriptase family protein, partial [Pseudomonadota bacterium]
LNNFQPSETISLSALLDKKDNITSVPPHVLVYEVYHLLKKIDSKKTSPDIPTRLYKEAAHLLAEPFTALFNQSLKNGIIPTKWKRTAVLPIPKCSRPSLNDLRQISLLPIPFKILEKLVLRNIQNKLLTGYGPNQYGFRPQSSTVCANIALHDYIAKTLEDHDVQGIQVIAYDFAKAFDRLKFEVIIKNLLECEVPAAFIRWINNYLTERQQYVRIGMTESNTLPISSGVPQGSVLGPYLFSSITGSFDVNDIPCKVIMYADDFTICVPIYVKNRNTHVLAAHNAVCKWSETVGLPLNTNKCRMMCISRKNNFVPVELDSVPLVNELKILGVIFDTKGDWNTHVNSVIRCASQRLFLIRLLKSQVNQEEICIAFNSLVRSILEYCAPLFIGLSKCRAQKLEKVVFRFHRLICGDDYKTCKVHNFENLHERRKRAAMKLFNKSLSKTHVLHHISPVISPSGRILLPLTKTNFRLNSFFEQTSRIFNHNFVRK